MVIRPYINNAILQFPHGVRGHSPVEMVPCAVWGRIFMATNFVSPNSCVNYFVGLFEEQGVSEKSSHNPVTDNDHAMAQMTNHQLLTMEAWVHA
jgi:hypothetical protein